MSFNGNVSSVLDNEKGSILTPGSEFRNKEIINPLFDLHEDGEKLKEIIEKGASYIFLRMAWNKLKTNVVQTSFRYHRSS